ncbi:glycosyl hydrolase family 76-domain-containing protein [Microdochium bolleyi]|uniref:mannan endo-1,6-alpha-mannosidase n=1 Tax=Microdochium bolleyi TaxID=196109 RepID=A0A136IS54_9PEZI|nr:glycosyl hydrolase family 76-domain-containing protein [Microdochium bolleyi]
MARLSTRSCAVACMLLSAIAEQAAAAAYYKIDNANNIKISAKTLAYDLMLNYKGNQSGNTPGILPGPPPAGPYYWWEGGAMWGAMMDYWHYTGDATYNDVVTQGMLWQTGPNNDYMPPNWTASLGNDDQAFWGMAALQAAEQNFPNPPKGSPGWLALAQAVFNTQAEPDRHDNTCGGGLRWQIPWYNNGYDYKNSIANGCFFNLGARLARYLNNQTCAKWADDTWNWMEGVGLISADNRVFDGAHVGSNCTDINKAQFSYNNAILLLGAAHMYNWTSENNNADPNSTPKLWKTRITNLLNGTVRDFFPQNIAYEASCEPIMSCTTDMLAFKGFTARWLTQMAQLAPFTASTILPILQDSAEAAVKQCTGGATGRQCGFQWITGKFDNSVGAGQTMNVLGAVSALLATQGGGNPAPPLTENTGGTSPSDPSAGATSEHLSDPASSEVVVTTGDKAGAGVVTVVFIALVAVMFGFMSSEWGGSPRSSGGSGGSGDGGMMTGANGAYNEKSRAPVRLKKMLPTHLT